MNEVGANRSIIVWPPDPTLRRTVRHVVVMCLHELSKVGRMVGFPACQNEHVRVVLLELPNGNVLSSLEVGTNDCSNSNQADQCADDVVILHNLNPHLLRRSDNTFHGGCRPVSAPWRFLAPLVHAFGDSVQTLNSCALYLSNDFDGGFSELGFPLLNGSLS